MTEKILNSRIILKHDIDSNWQLATGFTPLKGEIVIYDIDDNHSYERFKIGDGIQNVNTLPFADDALREDLVAKIENAKPLETTPEDIIEWMGEEHVITPLASSNGEVYITNDNKILIL
jgi:hypothetical protein